MKKLLLSCLAVLSVSANATVIDFESGKDALFNYDGIVSGDSNHANSGYEAVLSHTNSQGLAYNPYSTSPSTFSWAGNGTFDLTSFVIAGAWGSQTLTIEGLLNNAVTYSSQLAVDNINIDEFAANWSGIDAFRITTGNDFVQASNVGGAGQHWAIDNITVNPSVSVPTPAGILLFGLGLVGLALMRKTQA